MYYNILSNLSNFLPVLISSIINFEWLELTEVIIYTYYVLIIIYMQKNYIYTIYSTDIYSSLSFFAVFNWGTNGPRSRFSEITKATLRSWYSWCLVYGWWETETNGYSRCGCSRCGISRYFVHYFFLDNFTIFIVLYFYILLHFYKMCEKFLFQKTGSVRVLFKFQIPRPWQLWWSGNRNWDNPPVVRELLVCRCRHVMKLIDKYDYVL